MKLKAENIGEADSFIAATENEQTNLLSGMLARHLGVKQVIIHVSTTEYMPIVNEIGFGAVISKNMSKSAQEATIIRKNTCIVGATPKPGFQSVKPGFQSA